MVEEDRVGLVAHPGAHVGRRVAGDDQRTVLVRVDDPGAATNPQHFLEILFQSSLWIAKESNRAQGFEVKNTQQTPKPAHTGVAGFHRQGEATGQKGTGGGGAHAWMVDSKKTSVLPAGATT